MAIAIRTAVIQGGRLHVQAGAGIVHDSDPVKEWEETMSKGRALFRAVAEAARGLRTSRGRHCDEEDTVDRAAAGGDPGDGGACRAKGRRARDVSTGPSFRT